VRPNVRALKAYEQRKFLAGLNSTPMKARTHPSAGEDFLNKDVLCSLNRYPDPEAKALKKAFAKALKVTDKTFSSATVRRADLLSDNNLRGPVLFPTLLSLCTAS